MSIRNLDALFQPRSVAVIGASNRKTSVGGVVLRNLIGGGFDGGILPVNPKHTEIEGLTAYPDIASLPKTPDMAVICTPPATVPGLIRELGERGTRAATVLTAAVDQQAMLDASRPYLMRLLGNNCVGLLVPGHKMNASFAPSSLAAGELAFVSQSGAMCTAVLDWAAARGIGFSHFVSLGNSADVDFGDVVDYLANDRETRAILLYIESISHARKFLSACRAASRSKPIIAIKAGRNAGGAQAAASHTGALAGRDDVYDAAFSRAGVMRVDTTDELFEAVETLARAEPLGGEDLVIVTNGGGLGVLAADALEAMSGSLATLSDETISALDKVLPPTWSRGNPVDIIGDAPGSRYGDALEVLKDAPETDALLVMHAPTGITEAGEVARGVIKALKDYPKTVLTNWMGGRAIAPAVAAFEAANIPSFDTPASAVRAYMQLLNYRRLRTMLIETPSQQPDSFEPKCEIARAVIEGVLADKRSMLTEVEAKTLLGAYGIPIVETRVAKDADDAASLAADIGFPVAVKILSKDISHKSDVGGVALNLKTSAEVANKVDEMSVRINEMRPDASIDGFTVQKMIDRPGGHELILGAFVDKIFGPALLFGQGGTAVEVIADRSVALPPVNSLIADQLIAGTRVSKLLKGYRDRPAADLGAIRMALVKLSHLVADFAEITELDINPLLADDKGVIALDARVVVQANESAGVDRLAIRPYPSELEREEIIRDGETILVRPIRPEDEVAHSAFFDHLDSEDVRYRFFGLIKHPDHERLARFTQIDYEREMCLIAVRPETGETLGVVRVLTDPDNARAEYAVIVRSDLKGKGIGYLLMQRIIDYCRQRDTGEIYGYVLHDNHGMRKMVEELGFETHKGPDPSVVEVVLPLI